MYAFKTLYPLLENAYSYYFKAQIKYLIVINSQHECAFINKEVMFCVRELMINNESNKSEYMQMLIF